MNDFDKYAAQKYTVMSNIDELKDLGKKIGYTEDMIMDDIKDIIRKNY